MVHDENPISLDKIIEVYKQHYQMNQRKNNGYLNLLFDSEGVHSSPREKEIKHNDIRKIQQMVQENVLMPRYRLKNTRVLKINNSTIFNAQGDQISRQLKRMFVDGGHLAELIPRRQLATQNYQRSVQRARMYSPQIIRRGQHKRQTLSKWNETLTLRQREQQGQQIQINEEVEQLDEKLLEPEQYQTVQIIVKEEKTTQQQCYTVNQSINNSSIQNIPRGNSVRYRKSFNSEKKHKIQLQNNRKQKEANAKVLYFKKELVKCYSHPFGNPDNISSKAYIVIEHFREVKGHKPKAKLHTALNSKINLQIASLTKIMTFILTLQICDKFSIDVATHQIKIGVFETRIDGTSAQIQVGHIYTIQQLLYGLMLPSGNDASIALAIFCGQNLQRNKRQQRKNIQLSQLDLKKVFYKNFILQMNKKSLSLDMKRTFFTNSHGLPNSLNKSCAADIALLIDYALDNNMFRTIIGTASYECEIKYIERRKKSSMESAVLNKRVGWKNTHRFLHSKPQFYKGLKTGITETAGPCLSSLVQYSGREFIIVILNSRTLKSRYRDTENLRKWVFRKQNIPLGEND